jgi:hypothetical protein
MNLCQFRTILVRFRSDLSVWVGVRVADSGSRPSKNLMWHEMSGSYKKCVTKQAVVGLRPRFLYDRTIPRVHKTVVWRGFGRCLGHKKESTLGKEHDMHYGLKHLQSYLKFPFKITAKTGTDLGEIWSDLGQGWVSFDQISDEFGSVLIEIW